MSKRILFFGNERLATGVSTTAPTLRALIAGGYDVAALVIAQNEMDKSRQARELEIARVAEENNIGAIFPDNLSGATEQIASFNAEAAVLIAYGKIISEAVLDIFPKGIINVHPSLLPKHRGPTPLESVILNGESKTGVSLMKLAPEMDAGPVYAQQKVILKGTESKQELADQLSKIGSEMIIEHLPPILNNELEPEPQDGSMATYDEHLDKSHGLLDWDKLAVQLEREVRAYTGWPRSRTTINGTSVTITKAHILEGSGQPGELFLQPKQLGFYTSADILIIDSLIPAGKKEMSAQAFLAGYQVT